jgi:hypothetical protein
MESVINLKITIDENFGRRSPEEKLCDKLADLGLWT